MKKTLIVLTLGLGLLTSGCATHVPSAADGYTGTAVIKDSYRQSRKSGCKVVVKLPSGQEAKLSVGRRTSCTGWNPGRTVTLTNGRLNK